MVAALEFENLTKEYRSFASRRRLRALDGFSLRVEAGEIFGFLGPNGAGKSTAIHLAMGFMRPTSGCGRMLGQPFGYSLFRKLGQFGSVCFPGLASACAGVARWKSYCK